MQRRGQALLSLVGAGPGDPELITVKAIKSIQSADIILYDSLVNPQIFNLALEGLVKVPELIFVGKRRGHQSISQEDINKLILEQLRLGKHVLRLKGGDPFIFARGVEELEVAKKHGYDYKVIPGLTSGLAVPVARGITLTLRDSSDSVTLVTGHQPTADQLENWARNLDTGSTIVIYMGLSNIVKIIDGLKENLDATLPVIAIHNGTLDDEKIVISTLGYLAQDMINSGIQSPAILIFGQHISNSLQYSDKASIARLYASDANSGTFTNPLLNKAHTMYLTE
jgi:uroporphyrin-III C-methyltransferase